MDSSVEKKHGTSQRVIWLALALPPLFYYLLVALTVTNVPFWDDFDSILAFLIRYSGVSTLSEKVALVASQHNEHRPVLLHLISILDLKLEGQINFATLMILGNLILIPFFVLIPRLVRSDLRTPALMFPPVCLFFSAEYYDTMLWPTVLLSNWPVLFFALIFFQTLNHRTRRSSSLQFKNAGGTNSRESEYEVPPKAPGGTSSCESANEAPQKIPGGASSCESEKRQLPYYISAAPFAALGLMSQGNGILLFPLGTLFLAIHKKFSKETLIYLSFSIATCALYLLNFQTPPKPPLQPGLIYPLSVLTNTLGFIGSALPFGIPGPSIALGALICLYFLFLTWQKYWKTNPALYFFFLFLLLSAALSGFSRAGDSYYYALQQPRYKFLAILILISSYLSALEVLRLRPRKFFFAAACSTAFVFWLVSFGHYSAKVIEEHETLERGIALWYMGQGGLRYPVSWHAENVMRNAAELKIFNWDPSSSPFFRKLLFKENAAEKKQALPGTVVVDRAARSGNLFLIDGWGMIQGGKARLQKVTVDIVGSNQRRYTSNAKQLLRPDVARSFKDTAYLGAGYAALLDLSHLDKGDYSLIVSISNGDGRFSRESAYFSVP